MHIRHKAGEELEVWIDGTLYVVTIEHGGKDINDNQYVSGRAEGGQLVVIEQPKS